METQTNSYLIPNNEMWGTGSLGDRVNLRGETRPVRLESMSEKRGKQGKREKKQTNRNKQTNLRKGVDPLETPNFERRNFGPKEGRTGTYLENKTSEKKTKKQENIPNKPKRRQQFGQQNAIASLQAARGCPKCTYRVSQPK
jgi:hypothetical protein